MTRVIRRWPAVFGCVALATALVTLWILHEESDLYESVGTFVVRASAGDENDLIRATANLGGNEKINGTLSYAIESESLRQRVLSDEASPGGEGSAGFEVDASVAPGTNILTLAVRSRDPEVAFEMAGVVGEAAISYVTEIERLYELAALDVPEPPRRPSSVWFSPLRVLAALVAGSVAGAFAAGLAHLVFPRGWRRGTAVSEKYGTGFNEDAYTRLRFQEEMARADASGTPFDLAVMRVEVPFFGPDRRSGDVTSPGPTDVAKIARVISPTLRDYDHLGHLGEEATGTFAMILPGRSVGEADEAAALCEDSATQAMKRTYRSGATIKVGSCRYVAGTWTGDAAAKRVAELL